MERPVYHIKGVMKEKDQAADFVGPLDLILHLLRKNRLSIRDIPLAELLDQYLAWMAARRELDLEVAGEFIAMASHLMLLKTKMLLREEEEEALSEMEALMASLSAQERRAQQVRVQAVLSQLEAAFDGGRDRLTKEPEPSFARRVYRYSHTGEDLVQAMAGWRRRQGKSLPPDLSQFRNVVRHEPYRVERKAEELLTLLHLARPGGSRQSGRSGGPQPGQVRGHGGLSGPAGAVPGGQGPPGGHHGGAADLRGRTPERRGGC